MVRKNLVFIAGAPHWKENETPKPNVGKVFIKGAGMIGKGALIVGKAVGKQVLNASKNYAAQQERDKERQSRQQNLGSNQPNQQRTFKFPSSGFGV